MSVDEIKGELDRMSAPERARVQGYLRILRWKEEPGLAGRLADRHTAMDAGRKVSSIKVEERLQDFRCEEPASISYCYVLEEDVFESYVSLPEEEAELLCSFFRWLAVHPHSKGDGWHQDATGRANFASLCGPFLVVHWTDHASREVRVVQVLRE